MDSYKVLNPEQQREYVTKLKNDIILSEYENDFVAISKNTNKPVYNTLIDIANERAWEVSQLDYQDKISVTRNLREEGFIVSNREYETTEDKIVSDFLNKFFKELLFSSKMKMYCDFRDKYKDNKEIIQSLLHRLTNHKYQNYYAYYGTQGCRSRSYQESNLKRGFLDGSKEEILKKRILEKFHPGEKYPKSKIKLILSDIHEELDYSVKAKASDLGKYFELSHTTVSINGNIVSGFKITGYKCQI